MCADSGCRLSRSLAAAFPLALTGCVGWASASLPPSLTEAEERSLEGAHIPLTVGVVPHVHPAYSDRLVEALQGTGSFDRVALVEELDTTPGVFAHVDRQIHGKARVPWLTLLTFGVIPSSIDEEHGFSFWFSVPDPEGGGWPDVEGGGWHVEYSHTGRTTLGWVTILEVVLPDRTVVPFTVEGSQRMLDRLALAILEHRDALEAVGRGSARLPSEAGSADEDSGRR